jgi:predicted aspartyl protease
MTQQGFLIISDITGYSKYVNESELEHARDSLTALLNLLIDHTQSPLVLSKLEGDAVFSYAPAGGFLQGQSLLDMIESTYASFRKALELMVLNTTCTCNACRNLPNLDLKFFVHFGSYMTQKLGNFTELVGNDVNLVHRLAKNHIKDETGFKAYAAFTQSVMEALGLVDFQNSLTPHRETFADVGEVQMYVYDMHTVWKRLKDMVRIEVQPEEALFVIKAEFPVPPSIVWEYLTKPEYRTILMGASKLEIRNQSQGRTGVDSAFYCYHGDMETKQLILDWRPFEQFTTDDANSMGMTTRITCKLEPIQTGTRLIELMGKPRGAWLKVILFSLVAKFVFIPQIGKSAESLRQRIIQDLADGTAFVSPSIEVGKAQIASLATQMLTHNH